MTFAKVFFLLAVAVLSVSCAPRPVVHEKSNTITVWDFDDLSPSLESRPNLGEALSGEVIATLQKRANVTIVERERLLLALQELHLGSSSLADESTRLKLGKMAGARFMVFGGYQIIGNTMRLDIRLVEVETGKVIKAVQEITSSHNLQKRLDAARKAAEGLY
jgi:TolB-like protein